MRQVARRRHRRRTASHEVRCAAECCMRRARGGIWFSAPASPSPFPVEPAVLLSPPSPVLLRARVHPLVRSTPLQSAPCSYPPGCPSVAAETASSDPLGPRLSTLADSGQPPLGLAIPLRGLGACRRYDEGSRLVTDPPSAFLTPSTASGSHFVGLFHPTTTSRVSSSGAFPPATAVPASSTGSCPLVVGSVPLPPGLATVRRRFPSPRPQGLLSVAGSGASSPVVSRRRRPIPS